MDHFPIFIALKDRHVVLSGGGDAAIAKLRLLLKTTAQIFVYAPSADPVIAGWAHAKRLTLVTREMQARDTQGAALVYAANEDDALDAQILERAKDSGALVNVVDNLHDSAFITPAIVDRDPVTIAIGTEGAAPVLARAIKADLEAKLPIQLGTLAKIGKGFRRLADSLPKGRARRDFWRAYYFDAGPKSLDSGTQSARHALDDLLAKHLNKDVRSAHVTFVGAGPGPADLLTLKARAILDEADVIIHDASVAAEVLELARREALIIDVGTTGETETRALIATHTQNGAQVVRLCPGATCPNAEITACAANGLSHSVIPGIAASPQRHDKNVTPIRSQNHLVPAWAARPHSALLQTQELA